MKYRTKSGDTFEKIAYFEMGDSHYVTELIAANLDRAATFIFSAGVELEIPTIEKEATEVLPWQT